VSLILDAGALIAYDRGEHLVEILIRRAQRRDVEVRTTSGAVTQVWRGGPRQARLAMLLAGVVEVPLDPVRARRIGTLLGIATTADVVDGSVVDIARDGDEILTGDPHDIAALVEALGTVVAVTPV